MRRASMLPHDMGLLVILDALLTEGSVTRAAERLGLSPSAVSRALGEIRQIMDDRIFTRAGGQRMVPTARAQAMRAPLRALIAQAGSLLDPEGAGSETSDSPPTPRLRDERPPEPWQPARQQQPAPNPDRLARFVQHLRTVAGSASARALEMDEAEDAFRAILDDDAHPEQVGALLMILHKRGETAAELAGFIKAARAALGGTAGEGEPAIDWPIYISPRSRAPLWFLQSAALVARAGHSVLLHGFSGTRGAYGDLIPMHGRVLDIPVAPSLGAARKLLAKHRIAFLDLGAFAPPLVRVLRLRGRLGVHSLASAAVRHLRPLGGKVSLVGALRPPYQGIHGDALALLGDPPCLIAYGGRGVMELDGQTSAILQSAAGVVVRDIILSPVTGLSKRPRDGSTTFQHWQRVWTGGAEDAAAEVAIIETAALALMAARGEAPEDLPLLREEARRLWAARHEDPGSVRGTRQDTVDAG